MRGELHIKIALIIFSFYLPPIALADYPVPIRDQKTHGAGFLIKYSGNCSSGGQTAYLFGRGTENMKVGICRWMKSSTAGSTTFKHDVLYFNVPKNSNTDIPLGCSIPGSLIYKIIWFDIDTGYQPPDILLSSNTSLVLQRIKHIPGRYELLNANQIKTITVSYKLGNNGTILDLDQGKESQLAR